MLVRTHDILGASDQKYLYTLVGIGSLTQRRPHRNLETWFALVCCEDRGLTLPLGSWNTLAHVLFCAVGCRRCTLVHFE